MLLFSPTSTMEPICTSSRFNWCHWSEEGVVTSGEVALSNLIALVEQQPTWFSSPDRIALVLTSEEILHLSVNVPGRNVNSLRQALPFAVEEFITSDVEDVHIAHLAIRPNQPIDCAIIETARLSAWLNVFKDAGIILGAVVSQAQLIRPQATQVALMFDAAQVLIVTKDQDALVERTDLADILASLEVESFICIGDALTDLELGQLTQSAAVERIESAPLEYLLQQLNSPPGAGLKSQRDLLNLLQGVFAVRVDKSGTDALWRRTMGLAAACFTLMVGGMAAQSLWLEKNANQLDISNFSKYSELFPDDSVPATASQLQRRLTSKLRATGVSNGEESMVDLMLRTTSILEAGSEVQSIRFRAKKMELTTDVLITGFDELEAVKARSARAGINIEISDATVEQDRVRARMIGSYL